MEPREWLCVSGGVILLLMMRTDFTCYYLGKNEFLGATVITSMVTIIFVVGKHIVQWVWGGYT